MKTFALSLLLFTILVGLLKAQSYILIPNPNIEHELIKSGCDSCGDYDEGISQSDELAVTNVYVADQLAKLDARHGSLTFNQLDATYQISLLPRYYQTIRIPSHKIHENGVAFLNDSTKVKWLTENTIPIRSIDPNDDDFADLMPLKSSIGDARVVMLGEATHGDGATFYAKQRLVRFLHEVMGFDVLAWEMLFFAMEEMNQELEFDHPISSKSIWGEVGLMKPIYQYTRTTLKTDRPLRHTGFDFVFGYPRAIGIDQYHERLFEFLESEGSELASPSDLQTISEFFLTLQRGEYIPSDDEREKFQVAVGKVQDSLVEKANTVQNAKEFMYFAKTLENLALYEHHMILSKSMDPPPRNIFFRGRKMGENLIWLANEWYSGKKIIVWAGNRHVARNVSSIEILRPDDYSVIFKLPPEYREMGDIIYSELGESIYSIGFITYQGTRGRLDESPSNIETVPGSIESLWHHTGQSYSFLDFRSIESEHWLRKPTIAHVDGVSERTNWTNVFDGLFYIDTMFPNTELEKIPETVHTKR